MEKSDSALSKLCAPWDQASALNLKKVKGVCLDIDDTLSSHGKLTSEAYQALWSLKSAGFFVVPITGRPAGWCDHFARLWPIDAVVGENGAFTFFMENGVRRRINTPAGNGSYEERKKRLNLLEQNIRRKFKNVVFASDQEYRENDLAIDICEDVAPWSNTEVEDLLSLCKKEGAHAKLSSIHVNTWYGDYDKKSGFDFWLSCTSQYPKTFKNVPRQEEWLFIGDSPNDEPMFKAFQFSVGVANIKRYLDRITFAPRWLTVSESGAGFCEMAKRLVASHG